MTMSTTGHEQPRRAGGDGKTYTVPGAGEWIRGAGSGPSADIAVDDTEPRTLIDDVGEVGSSVYLTDYDLQTGGILASMELHRDDEDTVVATAMSNLHFYDGLSGHGLPEEEDGRDEWLAEHALVIDAFLADEYGVTRESCCGYEWECGRVSHATVELPAVSTTDDLVETVFSQTKAADLYNESDPGTYGLRSMWATMSKTIAEHDAFMDVARNHIAMTMLWGETDEDGEPLDTTYTVDDIDPESMRKICDEFERWAVMNRKHITAVLEQSDDPEDDQKRIAGHWWLVRNGHGVSFSDYDAPVGRIEDTLRKQRLALEQEEHNFAVDPHDPVVSGRHERATYSVAITESRLATARANAALDAATPTREIDLYVGDDGKIYAGVE